MKESQLENHLRSWTPRRPSASIKRRLFDTPVPPREEVPPAIGWHWLAPAMALFIGALIVLAHTPGSAESSGSNLKATFALSNLDFATYYADAGDHDHNILSSTFEWTNGAHSTTTAPSVFGRTLYKE